MPETTPIVFTGNLLKEDMSPLLAQIGYEGRPASGILGEGEAAHSNRVEWNYRTTAARALNAIGWGATYTLSAASAGTRTANLTQIMRKDVFVDGTSNASDQVGGTSIVDQSNLRLTEWANDKEYNVLNATLVTGTTGTTIQQMHGMVSWALALGTTTAGRRAWTTTNSGVTITVDAISQMQNRANKAGTRLTDFILADNLRRHISQTGQASTLVPDNVFRNQADSEIIQSVARFSGDFGQSMMHTSYDLLGLHGANASEGSPVLGVDRSMVEMATLRPVSMKRIPEREDGVAAVILGEMTLRVWTDSSIYVDWNRIAAVAS